MAMTSVRKRGSILGSAATVAGVVLSVSAGGTASAQNLLGNASFERSFAAVDFNDLIAGKTTLVGPHAGLTPWFVPTGTDVEHYFRRADGSLSIARVPHGECVIGMDFDPFGGGLGKIEQGFSAPYPKSTVPFYVLVGDFAGDRGKGAPRTASIGTSLKITTGATVSKWDSFPTPNFPGPNTTRESVFKPRVINYAAFGPTAAMSGVFTMWDNDDMGVLADAVHLFPVHQEDPACGDWRTLSGFSILEDGTWLTSTPTDPWQDLKMGTPSGCSCSTDNKFLTLDNGFGGASTMLVTAWDQNAGSARAKLELTLEIQSVSAYLPRATVSFYDFTNARWTSPYFAFPKLPPYPGFKVKAGIRCYTVDWDSLDVREPAPNTGVKTALSNYVQPGTGMVLARVIFANGEASWVNGPTTWPPTPPTISPWRMRIHSAAIVCN